MPLFRTQPGDDYEAIRAEVSFITDLQLEIEAAMDKQGLTQAKLAKLLNVSEARVSQILSDNGANLEARTIAKIAHRLGMKAHIRFDEPETQFSRKNGPTVCMAQWVRDHAGSGNKISWGRAIASEGASWDADKDGNPEPVPASAGAR